MSEVTVLPNEPQPLPNIVTSKLFQDALFGILIYSLQRKSFPVANGKIVLQYSVGRVSDLQKYKNIR